MRDEDGPMGRHCSGSGFGNEKAYEDVYSGRWLWARRPSHLAVRTFKECIMMTIGRK